VHSSGIFPTLVGDRPASSPRRACWRASRFAIGITKTTPARHFECNLHEGQQVSHTCNASKTPSGSKSCFFLVALMSVLVDFPRGQSGIPGNPGDYTYCACSRLYSRFHQQQGCAKSPTSGDLVIRCFDTIRIKTRG